LDNGIGIQSTQELETVTRMKVLKVQAEPSWGSCAEENNECQFSHRASLQYTLLAGGLRKSRKGNIAVNLLTFSADISPLHNGPINEEGRKNMGGKEAQ